MSRTPATTQSPASASTHPEDIEHHYRHLIVLPWHLESAAIPTTGHDPRSNYAERFWLPLLGPSALFVIRRLAMRLDEEPAGFELDAATLARAIGVGQRVTNGSTIVRTIDRCIMFRLAQLTGEILYLRQSLPTLSARQVSKLPPGLRTAHRSAIAPPRSAPHTELVRATALARALHETGGAPGEVERQLRDWGFDATVTIHAAQRAQPRNGDPAS